jgi:heme exporter protein D
LRRPDPPSKESYLLSVRFIISKFIVNVNRPKGIIRQVRRRRRRRKRIRRRRRRRRRGGGEGGGRG